MDFQIYDKYGKEFSYTSFLGLIRETAKDPAITVMYKCVVFCCFFFFFFLLFLFFCLFFVVVFCEHTFFLTRHCIVTVHILCNVVKVSGQI